MQLSADEISSIIKKQIQNFDRAAMVSETGTVLATGDGIARVYGLEGVMAGELLTRYEGELRRVSHAAAEERDRLRAEATKLEAQILSEARAAATKIVEEGRKRIDTEVNAIRFELGKQSERLAGDIATRVLGREAN